MYNRGFTLIEIIVITGVIAVLSGISIASYNNYTQQTILEKETIRLVETLQLARNRANASEETTCIDTFDGFTFHTTLNNNGYSLLRCCDGNCSGSGLPQAHAFPSILTLTTDTTDILFLPLAQGASFPLIPGTSAVDMILKHDGINQCYQITVTRVGVIEYNRIDCP